MSDTAAPRGVNLVFWLLAMIPGVLGLSFLVQSLQARLILGRNPVTCVDSVEGQLFEMHRSAGESLLVATLYGVLPLFAVIAVVRRVKGKPVRKPVFWFASGVALCVLIYFVNPWNYVDWWLD